MEDDTIPPPRSPVLFRVTAPGPVTGGVMGVAFANGRAVVDDVADARALAWFRAELGYQVEAVDPPAEDSPVTATTRRRK